MKILLWAMLGLSPVLNGIGQRCETHSVITWEALKDVKYKKKFSLEVGDYYLYPTFGKNVMQLNGKQVSIHGYVIPVDTEGQYYVLSKWPMAQCFFCGLAGPETIIMLNFKGKHRRFKTDEKITFCGRLRLNANNLYELNFNLDEATLAD